MASALPFTGWTGLEGLFNWNVNMLDIFLFLYHVGGIYGFVRGIIGPYLGFFVGVFEICCGLLLIALYVVAFAFSVNCALGLPDQYQILFYPIPYILNVLLQCWNRRYFSSAVICFTLLGLLSFSIFLFGSFSQLNQTRYGNHSNAHPESTSAQLHSYFRNSSFAIFLYWGIETIPVISNDAAQVCLMIFTLN